MKIRHLEMYFWLVVLLCGSWANAQLPNASLAHYLEIAERNYPMLAAKQMEVSAAAKAINGVQKTMVPSLDASYQLNYATYNNITGMAFPQYLVPISGPPSTGNNFSGVFGSSASMLLNWQPITFGQRNAQLGVAVQGYQLAQADAGQAVFQHKVGVINAYLDWVTAAELERICKANLERTESSLRLVVSLANSGIRPGVDTAIVKAEVSKTRVELLNSRKQREQARIYLSQLLAVDTLSPPVEAIYFSKLPVNSPVPDSFHHPLLRFHEAQITLTEARKKAVGKAAAPTLAVWGTTYGRGSGISYNGDVNALNGLGFQRINYGGGIQLSVPILKGISLRPQVEQQVFLMQAGQERLKEAELYLNKQAELADAALGNAYAIAAESPLFLESARFSFLAVQSRYQAGLTGIADLLQAQYALVKAETDNRLAYIAVWKAFLFKAAVGGNLNTFLEQTN